MKQNSARVFPIIILLAWLSQLFYLLPPPSGAIDSVANTMQQVANETARSYHKKGIDSATAESKNVHADIRAELWQSWSINLSITLIGVAAVTSAFFSTRFWRVAVLVSTMLFLSNWTLGAGLLDGVDLWRSYQIKSEFAKTVGNSLAFVHRDIVLPLVYIAAIFFVALNYFTGRQQK